MIACGLDRLLDDPSRLAGRRYALLTHAAAVSSELVPCHLALAALPGTSPAVLFGPEHGLYAVEQDMVPAAGGRDPLTGLPLRSLYGDSEGSLSPPPEAFRGVDLLVVDLQDVGARYYTYAASAVWAAAAAATAGCQVWVLDRPNPLGGDVVEGNLPRPGFESFVGAFRIPVRHGLTLGELVRLEARRGGWEEALEVWPAAGWRRSMLWPRTGRPWLAPSPNMPTFGTAVVYPGACLLEGTELSEGRGTTRPFELVGAPGLPAAELARFLDERHLPGVRFLPTFFRPQFQKHRGEVCGGVEVVVTDAERFPACRAGVELLSAVRQVAPEGLSWRRRPYEFIADRPALDLLTGGDECRRLLEEGADPEPWLASWGADEERFRRERRAILLYPETDGETREG